ncbi:MAG: hypothetical protein JST83_15475 [Bacteroidetes bacterium]|nr:hypothetical protein [Bacteroidota bacterium]
MQEQDHGDPVFIVKVLVALTAMCGCAVAASGYEVDNSLHILLGCVNIAAIGMMAWESGLLNSGYTRFGLLAFGVLTLLGLYLDDKVVVRSLHLISIGLVGMAVVYTIRFYQKADKKLLDLFKLAFPVSLAFSFLVYDVCMIYRYYLVVLPNVIATLLFAVYVVHTIRKEQTAVHE